MDDDKLQLRRIMDRLAESVETASDEEILEDARLAGEDPAQIATDTKAVMLDSVRRWKEKQKP